MVEADCGLVKPGGNSVNDGISPELCSRQYLCVDDVIQQMVNIGQVTLLA